MAERESRRRSRAPRRPRSRSVLSPRLRIGRCQCCQARAPVMQTRWGPRCEVCDAVDFLRRVVHGAAS
eukprot:1518902-Alexandrium_andersonii.AAC.1